MGHSKRSIKAVYF